MLNNIPISRILFLDIETVPEVYEFSELDDAKRKLWDIKSRRMQRDDKTAEDVYEKAGIFAEFGKIVCISVGFITTSNNERQLRLKSFFGDDEQKLLRDFSNLLNTHFSSDKHLLCAHNGKEFDFPYIARRLLINQLSLPSALDIAGKKPWEINHLDTMEFWKFGDYKHYTSLSLLTHVFGIPTPKDDISGADVSRVYWEEQDLDRITEYCEKDVKATAQLMLRYRGEPLISDQHVISVDL